MNILLRNVLAVLSICCFLAGNSFAQDSTVEYRGFQTSPQGLSDSELADMAATHNVNLIRYFISSANLNTNFGSEAEYIAAVDEELQKIEEKLPAVKTAGMKVMLAFAFPPKGFVSGANPPRSQMFVDTSLQEWYLNMLARMIERFATQISDGDIVAVDILTEPATGARTPGADNGRWDALASQAISRVRAVSDIQIIYKPLYGNLNNLKSLPCLNQFTNVKAGVHVYPALNYQHTGEESYGSDPFSIARPGINKIQNKILEPTSAFVRNQMNNCSGTELTDLYIDVGEFTAPACAIEADEFTEDVVSVLERDDLSGLSSLAGEESAQDCRDTFTEDRDQLIADLSCDTAGEGFTGKQAKRKVRKCKQRQKRRIARLKTKRKKCISRQKKKKKQNNSGGKKKKGNSNNSGSANKFRSEVRFASWTWHSIGGTQNFDPRYECSNSGNLTFVGQTDRFDVLDVVFARNELFGGDE